MRAISGADMRVFEASRIDARCRVEKCLARSARRFNMTASSCANGLTNTSGARTTTTSLIVMHPSSPPAGGFRSNLQRRPTRSGRAARERLGDARRDLERRAVEVFPRDLRDAPAGGGELGVAPAVVAERLAVAVRGEAVE